jgi:hypothetical protein
MHAKALQRAAEWLSKASKTHPMVLDLRWAVQLTNYAERLEDAKPWVVCPYCETQPAPKRAECPQCKGRRILTEKEFEGFKRERR